MGLLYDVTYWYFSGQRATECDTLPANAVKAITGTLAHAVCVNGPRESFWADASGQIVPEPEWYARRRAEHARRRIEAARKPIAIDTPRMGRVTIEPLTEANSVRLIWQDGDGSGRVLEISTAELRQCAEQDWSDQPDTGTTYRLLARAAAAKWQSIAHAEAAANA